MLSNQNAPGRLIAYIMAAVLVWGGALAFGAYLYGGPRQLLRAGIIIGCVMAFLGLWCVLLKYRAAVRSDEAFPQQPPKPPQSS